MKGKTCTGGNICSNNKSRGILSWLPAVAVAVLPKCPFCLMAYSGAVSLCSGNMLYPNAGSIMSYVTIALALVVMGSIVFNQKGTKTWIALLLALAGIAFLVLGQFYFISSVNYYIGVMLLFFGIWLNGSFLHYYYKYAQPYLIIKKT